MGATYGGGAAYTLAGSTTLYAQWTPNPTDTLTFNTQGGSAVAPVSGLDGTSVLLPGAPIHPGYTFAGWNSAADGSGTTYGGGAAYTLAGSTTLYAQWTPNPTDTLTFNTQGGSAVAPVSGLDGTTVTLPAAPTRAGYTFAGWFAAASGGSALTSPYTLAGSTTLYAQWTPNPTDTLTFNTQGGSAVAPVSGLDGTTVTLPAAPTRAGYTFAGWFAAASGGSALTSPYTLAGSTTLYAQWTPNPTDTLTFNTQGGSAVAPVSGLDGTTVTLPAAPTRAGYTFAGWFAAASGGSALTSPYTLAGSTTLYAQWTPNPTDTLTFNTQGGSAVAPVSGLDGTTVTLPAAPTRAGYTFAGWFAAASGGSALTSPYTLAGSTTLYAQWTPNPTDTLTFNTQGGSAVAPVSGLDGTTVTLPAAPTRAGYTFAGWFAAASGGSALTSPYTLAGSTTLYAQWTPNPTDTLTFNTQGGSAVAPVSGLDGTSVLLPGAPIHPGYTFAGWNSAADGSGTTYGGGAAYTLAGSTTLYAQWTPNPTDTLTFNTQGGSAVAPVSGLDGTTVTLPAAPTRAGYTFAGWFAAASGGSALTSPYTLAGSTTLYAQWTPNPTDTLTFNTQGGSAVAPVSGLDGTTVTLPAAPTRAGYTFAGWFAAASGGSALTSPYTLAGSTTLYAQWTPNPTDTLTFNTQGGSAVAPVSGLDGTTVTLPAAPTRAGYTFAGWFAAASGGSALTSPYTLAGSTTLYAQWTPNPTDTLTFNTQGGSAVAPVSGLDGTTVTLPAAPTRAGYTFAGWFAAASGGSALTSPYTLAGSTTLYAQWTPNPTDTLTFNTQGGSAVAPVSGLDGTTVTLPAAPTRAGYTFAGWFAAASGGSALTSPYTLAGSTTLYAQWTPNPTDTLTFNTQGGSAVAPVSGLDGTTVTLPAAPTRAGYTFAGWFAAASGGSALTSPYTLAGSTTLYAQWTPNPTDTLTFNTQGGSAVAPVSGLDGTTVTLPAAPTRAGYTFAGWFAAASGGSALTSPYTLAGSTTLYAQWTPNPTDTLTFNTQGGSAVAPVSGLDGTTVTLPAAPTRAGYTFAGWFAAASGGSALTSPYTLAGSTTLYAQWTPNPTDTLTFNTQGGSAVAPVSGLDGTTVTLPAAPTRAGYTFAGWFAAASGGSALTSPYTLAGSTTLYAQWTPNPTDTLTFNTQGGSAVAPVSGLDGTTVTLPAAPTRAGYTFAGWFAAASGGSALTSPYTLAGSTTLYAQWTPNPTDTLTFNTQGGSAVAPVSGLDGTTVTLPAAPTRAGYTFAGWFAAASGGSALTSPYTLAGSTTLYAQWTPNPTDTLTFNTQGGSAVAPVSGLDGTTVTLPAAPTRAGYTFAGWFAAASGGSALTSPYTLAGSKTLYAQWTPIPTVSKVSPSSGPTAGGTTITVTGTGFVSGASVVIGQGNGLTGAIVATVTSVTATTITAVTGGGAKAGTFSVYVTTPGGTSAANSGDNFTYDPIPTVSKVSPSSGPTAGGTTITVTGTGFVSGASVVIGQGNGLTGAIVATVTSVTATTITAVTGGGAKVGTWDVFVTTPGGTSAANTGDNFTYDPIPTVSKVSPSSGPTAGGTTITVTGTGFVSGASVVIGQGNGLTGAIVATVTSVTATTITAVTGGGAKAGTFSVYVTTPGGTSAANSGDNFTYDPIPTVSKVSPSSGPTAGGTTITVTGTGFVSGASVVIGQGNGLTGAIVATVTSVTATTITAVTGGGAKVGTWDVFVTTPGGTSAANTGDNFTYDPIPTVSKVSPSSGPTAGGTTITVTGTGFVSGASVVIGQGNGLTGAIVATVTSVTATTITAVTGGGAKAGTFSVYVTTPGGTSAANSGDNFTYHP